MATWFEKRHADRDQQAHVLAEAKLPEKYGDPLMLLTACGRAYPAGTGGGHRQVDMRLVDRDRLCEVCSRQSAGAHAVPWPIQWSRVEAEADVRS